MYFTDFCYHWGPKYLGIKAITQNTFSSQGIGFQFLARMLRSKDSPDGCPKLMFQSVALSVLSCFANEAEIMTHPSVST